MAKLRKHLEGKGLVFEVTEDSVTTEYALRAPMPDDRDAAEKLERTQRRWMLMTDKEIKQLATMPAPESEMAVFEELMEFEEEQMRAETDDSEIEDLERRIKFMRANTSQRTAADSVLDDIIRNKRNRFLAKTLIIDKDGKSIDIEEQSIAVQDTARDTAGKLWGELNELPFLSEQFSKQK